MPSHEIKARFIEPMLLQRTQSLPDGPGWSYEVKLDGYRALAIKTSGKILLRSRNNKDFNAKYPGVAKALGTLPDETVIDGEVVALDESGRPSFNLLQNVGPSKATVVYYVFDRPGPGREECDGGAAFDAPPDIAEPGPAEAQRAGQRVAPVGGEPCRTGEGREGARLRGHRRQAPGQPVRAGPAHRGLAKDADQPGPGIRHRRVHTQPEELRHTYLRVLRRGQAHLCCQDPQRVYASFPNGATSPVPSAGNPGMPLL